MEIVTTTMEFLTNQVQNYQWILELMLILNLNNVKWIYQQKLQIVLINLRMVPVSLHYCNKLKNCKKKLTTSINENKNNTEKNQQLTTEIEATQTQMQTLHEELDAALMASKASTKEQASLEERVTQLTKEIETLTNTSNKQQQDLDNQIQRKRNNLQS